MKMKQYKTIGKFLVKLHTLQNKMSQC